MVLGLDVTQQPEILQTYCVLSTPGIVLNSKLEYPGGLDEAVFRVRLKAPSGG